MGRPGARFAPGLGWVGWALLVAACGCSGGSSIGRVPVTGTVNLGGQPMAKGSIIFEPIAPTQGVRCSAIITDGKFALSDETGPVEGLHRVEIYADQGIALEEPEVAAALPGHRLPPNPVNERFNKQSELTANVSPSAPPLHFDVEN
jgi:hypothetical protein